MKKPEFYWVYILYCENNSYYTGYARDLLKRYQSHVDGTGKCKYTRSFKPRGIAQCWKILGDQTFAMQIERYIKSLCREDKEKLVRCPSLLATDPRIEIVNTKLLFQDCCISLE